MIVAGIGAVLIIVGVVLLFVRKSQQRKLAAITSTETSTVEELTRLAADVNKEVQSIVQSGGADFHQHVEVKGVIRSDSPITSEIAKERCVYYETEVIREFERQETTGSGDDRRTETRRSSETISRNKYGVPFWVEDATGKILVDPSGADVDAVKVADRFEPNLAMALSIGGFTTGSGGGIGNTIGYRFKEKILPLDRSVYVLGEANTSSGQLRIQKATEKGKNFIISLKSEEELVSSTGNTIMWLLVGGIACSGIGVVVAVLGLAGRLSI